MQLPEALQTRQVLLDAMKKRILSQSDGGNLVSVVGAKRSSTAGATTSAHGIHSDISVCASVCVCVCVLVNDTYLKYVLYVVCVGG